MREHFFGRDPEVAKLIEGYSDDQLWGLKRGGHDYRKVYAAFKAAMEHQGQPTVILAKTIKGYGLGPSFEGRNATHQMKKLTVDNLKQLRDVMRIPFTDAQLEADPYQPPFYHPGQDDEAIKYLQERRRRARRLPARAPLEVHADRAARRLDLRGREEGLGQAGRRDDDGVRPPAQGPAEGPRLRSPDRADHPG